MMPPNTFPLLNTLTLSTTRLHKSNELHRQELLNMNMITIQLINNSVQAKSEMRFMALPSRAFQKFTDIVIDIRDGIYAIFCGSSTNAFQVLGNPEEIIIIDIHWALMKESMHK
ncbi:hypothetical protein CDAR_92271 [Caerostris darwini]|uniref:Uncharacterized protein n=1 Tax=Caerostris darwini TaxID=1538125 RepID=A0AAV4S6U1_9ARAC|nr:hypothetical protein CDAR_92271 [Caerostris darwini]